MVLISVKSSSFTDVGCLFCYWNCMFLSLVFSHLIKSNWVLVFKRKPLQVSFNTSLFYGLIELFCKNCTTEQACFARLTRKLSMCCDDDL